MTTHSRTTFSVSAFGVGSRPRRKVVEGWPTNRELSQNMVRGGGRSEWNRTYFFNPACQSETTLIADVPGAGGETTTNRWPSGVTSYRYAGPGNSRIENRARGVSISTRSAEARIPAAHIFCVTELTERLSSGHVSAEFLRRSAAAHSDGEVIRPASELSELASQLPCSERYLGRQPPPLVPAFGSFSSRATSDVPRGRVACPTALMPAPLPI
jgi:hypothetical protein